jgi:hypothetical protein
MRRYPGFQLLFLARCKRPAQLLYAIAKQVVGILQRFPSQDVGRVQDHSQPSIFHVPRPFSHLQAAHKHREQTTQLVLCQNYHNLEYLLVDGGSTDGSLDLIQRYAGRLAWCVSEPDQGQAKAITKGFHRTKGEIIAWINSDDVYYRKDVIGQAVKALQVAPQAVI